MLKSVMRFGGHVAIAVVGVFLSACGGPRPMANNSVNMVSGNVAVSKDRLEDLKEKYPRIPAGRIRLPTAEQLRTPNFDVGGHCLNEERAGRGSFEQCIEVVGRELIAAGGPS